LVPRKKKKRHQITHQKGKLLGGDCENCKKTTAGEKNGEYLATWRPALKGNLYDSRTERG